MGAVKTNRKRWITDQEYKTLAWWERRKKLAKYIRMQNISDIKDTNNRRKMAGLKVIRRGKELNFTIPGELCDLNTYIRAERTNKYEAARIKSEQTEICAMCCARLKKTDKPVHITYKWYCKDMRKDKDNIAFAHKFVQDGLVVSGIIKNDGWSEIEGFTDEFYIDRRNPRVEIWIREV